MNINHELISKYLDGELSNGELTIFEKLIENNVELARELNEYKLQDNFLFTCSDAINRDPVPNSIVNLLQERPSFIKQLKSKLITYYNAWKTVVRPLPAALGLFIAAGIALYMSTRTDVTQQLYAFLDEMPSGSTRSIAGESTTQVLAFNTHDGSLCKVYQNSSNLGIACKSHGYWTTRVSIVAVENAGIEDIYVPASSDFPEQIESFIETHILGEPLTPEDERRLFK